MAPPTNGGIPPPHPASSTGVPFICFGSRADEAGFQGTTAVPSTAEYPARKLRDARGKTRRTLSTVALRTVPEQFEKIYKNTLYILPAFEIYLTRIKMNANMPKRKISLEKAEEVVTFEPGFCSKRRTRDQPNPVPLGANHGKVSLARWSEVMKSLEVRFDPLLGTSSRIAEGVVLPKAEEGALAPLQAPNSGCPFCPDRISRALQKCWNQFTPADGWSGENRCCFPTLFLTLSMLRSRFSPGNIGWH